MSKEKVATVPKLSSVHDALQEAMISERDRVCLINFNFRVHPVLKEIAEDICSTHGTTLSAYMRSCVTHLVRDYGGEKMLAQLNGAI